MNTRNYTPAGSHMSSGRRFREQEPSDVPTHLPTIRFTGKLRIDDDFPGLGKDPYNHVGVQLRTSKTQD